MSYKILIAEDDAGLNEGIRLALKQDGIAFLSAYTLREAREYFESERPDMILLDVNFPDGNGFCFLQELRKISEVPVLMITANDLEADEVKGLILGADDYITKPFSLMALRARVEGIRRRCEKLKTPAYERDGYRFDFEKFEFWADGREIYLSASEQKLLKLLVEHPGQTLPRNMLAERIWIDGMEYVDENALSVTVSRLRRKLEIKGAESPISTVYGVGYMWKGDLGGVIKCAVQRSFPVWIIC
ncbi:MAG: response regulator transcription factor [Eubacteriales bacterium]|nr:response regulator transcription factor [Eubacteriales bacterium]